MDTLTSLIIIMATVIVLVNFAKYAETAIVENKSMAVFYETVNNVTASNCDSSLFTTWDVNNVSSVDIETDSGTISITCQKYPGVVGLNSTTYANKMVFVMGDIVKEVITERSEYNAPF